MNTNSLPEPTLGNNDYTTINQPATSSPRLHKSKMGRKLAMYLVTVLLLANATLYKSVRGSVNRPNDSRIGIGKFEKSTCPSDILECIPGNKNFIFGYVTVPERHNQHNGLTIRLAVAVFPSVSETPSPAPLVLCSTGPGTSAMEDFFPKFAGGNNPILTHCDAVVIELRGLRYSEPNLLCKDRCDMMMATLGENLSADEMMARLLRSMRESYDRFANAGINVAAYNNVETAADIAMVMDALGYEKFNLFGNSAGTIIAQHVLRDYHDRLRCVILSSPVPLGARAFESMISNAVKSLQQVFKLCASDEKFNAAYPNLETEFLNLLERLNARSVTIPIEDPVSGNRFDFALNGDRLAQWLFVRMFQNSQFPVDLGKIISGDYTPLQENAWIFFPMYTFSYGLGNSIALSEADDAQPENAFIPESYSVFAHAVSAAGFGHDFIRRARRSWTVPTLVPSAREAVTSDVPTLILCGEFDHVCPQQYGRLMTENLSNAHLFTFPGVSHSPIDAGPCALSIALEFLKDPTTAPDTSCIGQYEFRLQTTL